MKATPTSSKFGDLRAYPNKQDRIAQQLRSEYVWEEGRQRLISILTWGIPSDDGSVETAQLEVLIWIAAGEIANEKTAHKLHSKPGDYTEVDDGSFDFSFIRNMFR